MYEYADDDRKYDTTETTNMYVVGGSRYLVGVCIRLYLCMYTPYNVGTYQLPTTTATYVPLLSKIFVWGNVF